MAMLGLYEFNRLSMVAQAGYLHEQGTYLATRKVGSYYTKLYFVNSFFAEEIHDLKTNAITDIRTFISRRNAEPYLPFLVRELP